MKNKLASAFARRSNTTYTENGAETYRSTLNPVLDFFYLAPARQDQDNTGLFQAAFESDPLMALKCAFYIRDVRGGKKQRNTFNSVLAYLYTYEKRLFNRIVSYVPEYGYWKDVVGYVDSSAVVRLVSAQLNNDFDAEHPSLLAKWMPSENASSKATRELARKWMRALDMSPASYRKTLSMLRARIDIPERKMSAQEWDDIKYPQVPSRAMKLYRKAFERHDENRFKSFIGRALKGEVKINSSQVYPHEIVQYFLDNSGNDLVYEAMWKQLPNYFGDEERSILPLIDSSSSMVSHNVLHIAIALGMYCTERNNGPFKDLFFTFNSQPEILKIEGTSLRTRVNFIKNAPWGGSTNLQAAFDLLLATAIKNEVPQEDMPTNIVILSDMEFDNPNIGGKNFDVAKAKFVRAGYDFPMITFWNLNARHNQTPVTKEQKGAFLVSGFSAETIGKVLNAEAANPEQLMLETLNSERYAFLDSLVK